MLRHLILILILTFILLVAKLHQHSQYAMSNSCEIPQGREYANENVNDNPPSASALKAADAIEVFDEEGKKHTFKSIYKRPDLPKRVLVVFVRHFYCCVSHSPQTSSSN